MRPEPPFAHPSGLSFRHFVNTARIVAAWRPRPDTPRQARARDLAHAQLLGACSGMHPNHQLALAIHALDARLMARLDLDGFSATDPGEPVRKAMHDLSARRDPIRDAPGLLAAVVGQDLGKVSLKGMLLIDLAVSQARHHGGAGVSALLSVPALEGSSLKNALATCMIAAHHLAKDTKAQEALVRGMVAHTHRLHDAFHLQVVLEHALERPPMLLAMLALGTALPDTPSPFFARTFPRLAKGTSAHHRMAIASWKHRLPEALALPYEEALRVLHGT